MSQFSASVWIKSFSGLTAARVGPRAEQRLDLSGAPTQTEIRKAIKGLKSGKAPGANRLTPELFKFF